MFLCDLASQALFILVLVVVVVVVVPIVVVAATETGMMGRSLWEDTSALDAGVNILANNHLYCYPSRQSWNKPEVKIITKKKRSPLCFSNLLQVLKVRRTTFVIVWTSILFLIKKELFWANSRPWTCVPIFSDHLASSLGKPSCSIYLATLCVLSHHYGTHHSNLRGTKRGQKWTFVPSIGRFFCFHFIY